MEKVNVTDFFKTRTGEYVPDYAKRILNLFSLLHLSEITFSRLKINKNKYKGLAWQRIILKIYESLYR